MDRASDRLCCGRSYKVESGMKIFTKRCIFPGVCAVVAAAMFVGVYLLLAIGTVQPMYFEGLLFLVPAIIFDFLTFLLYKKAISSIAANVVTAILIPVFAVLCVFLLFFMAFSAAEEPCEDPKYYTRAYGMYTEDSTVAKIFPEKIPEDAEDVHFHYHGAFLQGGGELSLKYTTYPSELDSVAKKLERSAVWSGEISEFWDWDERLSYFSGTSFWGTYGLPEDATLYLIEFRNPYGEGENGYSYWNHGEYIVVAVSDESDEIVYRYCYW